MRRPTAQPHDAPDFAYAGAAEEERLLIDQMSEMSDQELRDLLAVLGPQVPAEHRDGLLLQVLAADRGAVIDLLR